MKRKAVLLLGLMVTALVVASGTALALTCTAGTTCLGTNGDDVINGTTFADTIRARLGNDTVLGKGHNDAIYGQSGQDTLVGGPGRDTLVGGDQKDTLVGGDQSDRLAAGSKDTFEDGRQQLKGGFGEDIYLFSGHWGGVEIPAAGEPPRGTDESGNLTEANDALIFSAFESQAVKQLAHYNSLQINLQEGYASDLELARIGWQLFILADFLNDQIGCSALIDTYATRLSAQPLIHRSAQKGFLGSSEDSSAIHRTFVYTGVGN